MATLFIGQNKVFLPVTDSTNSYAITMLKNVNCIEGTVVYTSKQTNGKGQRGNVWNSESSMNITLSVVLKPSFLPAQKAFYLSKIAALAIHDVLAEIFNQSQFDIKIKWPNDILVNGKKVAGVLIENSVNENSLAWSVIGIGLNVNQVNFDGLPNASSIKLLSQKNYELETISDLLYTHLEKWYLRLKQSQFETINTAYHSNLFGYRKKMWFAKSGKTFEATVNGVNELGLLRLQSEDGKESSFEIKEVSFIL